MKPRDTHSQLLVSAAAYLKWYRRATYRHAKRDILLAHLNWYWSDARMGIVRADGKIVAIALARCVQSVEQAMASPYAHEEQAPMVWVEDIVSTDPAGVPQLFLQVGRRFGERETFAGNFFNRAGELRMLPYRILQRFTEGNHHGLTFHSRATCSA